MVLAKVPIHFLWCDAFLEFPFNINFYIEDLNDSYHTNEMCHKNMRDLCFNDLVPLYDILKL